jgi:hypothetical protein
MSTAKQLIDDIENEIKKVTKVAPFKYTNFGPIPDSPVYPSLNFMLLNRDHFDDVSIRPSGMLLRWELTYEVHVLYAGIDRATTRLSGRQYVDQAVELFVDQMTEDKRLNGKAFYLEPSNIRYGRIELETATGLKNIDGGIFTLTIRFLQEKDT